MALRKKPVVKPGNTKKKKRTADAGSRRSSNPIAASDASVGELEKLSESEERYHLFQGILQSSSDGILAVNRENEVLFANQRFVEMWMIPQETMAKRDDTLLIQYVLDQLSDPQAFLDKVRELYNSTEESFDTLNFKDGRVFDRLSRPLLQGTELRGRIWSFRDITERRQAEEKLRESEERYRLITQNAEDIIWTANMELQLTYVSPSLERALGYTAGELMALPPEQLLTTESLASGLKAFREEVAASQPQPDPYYARVLEMEYRRKNGSIFWIEMKFSFFRDSSGRLTGVLGVGRDVTERKRAEEVLRESESFVKTVLDNLPIGIAVNSVDPTVTFDYMNDNFPKFYRTTREKLADPDAFWNTVYEEPAFREEMKKKVLDDLASGNPERMAWVDVPITRKGEETTFISARDIPIPNKPLMISTVWDVTDRKRIEDALSASEAELRTLFASMHDVVLVIDREGVYRKIAPTNPGLLAKPPEELLGQNLNDVFPLKEAELFRRVIKQVLDTKQNTQIEYELLINGQTMWFQTTISPLGADSTLWVAHDITERKHVEEDLHQAEEKYRSIFENSVEGIFQSTPQGRFIIVNPAFARMLGYESPEELIAAVTDIASQIYMEAPRRAEFMQVMAEHGRVSVFEFQMQRRDGSALWVSESAHAVRDCEGRIIYYEGIAENITERKQAEEELRLVKDGLEITNIELQQSLEREKLLASTDGLTGLCNRRHLFELADREFQAAVRYRRPLTFLMFDIDDFKQVNDTFGHIAGDQLLVRVAQAAIAQVRGPDVVARYGGDKFIVLLPNASAQQALPVAERIRAHVAALRVGNGKLPITITLSIGIAEMQHEPLDENVERIIQRADEALYQAKEGGRDRTVIFDRDEA